MLSAKPCCQGKCFILTAFSLYGAFLSEYRRVYREYFGFESIKKKVVPLTDLL